MGRKKMRREDRAKQFMPFAALKGKEEEDQEKKYQAEERWKRENER